MDDAVQNVGPQKIIAITTDLSSLNLLAAQETVRQLNYRHIITLPCVPPHLKAIFPGCLLSPAVANASRSVPYIVIPFWEWASFDLNFHQQLSRGLWLGLS